MTFKYCGGFMPLALKVTNLLATAGFFIVKAL